MVGTIMATAGTRRPTRKGCPNHPLEFKCALAAAACDPAVSVAKLALEHGVNTNLLFKWRRQYRSGKFGVPDSTHLLPTVAVSGGRADHPDRGVTLLPVEIPVTPIEPMAASPWIEVTFTCATVRISGTPAATTLRTVLDTLARHA
jgi:transposase